MIQSGQLVGVLIPGSNLGGKEQLIASAVYRVVPLG